MQVIAYKGSSRKFSIMNYASSTSALTPHEMLIPLDQSADAGAEAKPLILIDMGGHEKRLKTDCPTLHNHS